MQIKILEHLKENCLQDRLHALWMDRLQEFSLHAIPSVEATDKFVAGF
jgi:hypothetical protein